MDRDCWARFQKIFVVSEEIREPFLRIYPEYRDRLQELPNLVNQEKIRRLAREPGGFSDGWDGLRLLSVGRLTYQKAFEIAVDAMRLLKDADFKVRWYVLGEGVSGKPWREKLLPWDFRRTLSSLERWRTPIPITFSRMYMSTLPGLRGGASPFRRRRRWAVLLWSPTPAATAARWSRIGTACCAT